jgi:hypothetical protein
MTVLFFQMETLCIVDDLSIENNTRLKIEPSSKTVTTAAAPKFAATSGATTAQVRPCCHRKHLHLDESACCSWTVAALPARSFDSELRGSRSPLRAAA